MNTLITSRKVFVSNGAKLFNLKTRYITYEVTPSVEKIVINKYPDEKSIKKEKWQNVRPMGYEKQLRDIKRIEFDPRLESDPVVARNTAFTKLQSMKDSL